MRWDCSIELVGAHVKEAAKVNARSIGKSVTGNGPGALARQVEQTSNDSELPTPALADLSPVRAVMFDGIVPLR